MLKSLKLEEQAEITMQILRKLDEIGIKASETKNITESQIRNNKTRERATTDSTEVNNESSHLRNINPEQQNTETVDANKNPVKASKQ